MRHWRYDALAQVLHEHFRVLPRALADNERRHELRRFVQGTNRYWSPMLRLRDSSGFTVIAFSGRKSRFHRTGYDPAASHACADLGKIGSRGPPDHEASRRVAVNAGESLNRPQAVALDQEVKDADRLFRERLYATGNRLSSLRRFP